MSQVVKCSINGKTASEVQVLFKLPVLDCDDPPQAMQGSVLDSTTRISVQVEISSKKNAKDTSINMEGESLFNFIVFISQSII